MNSHENFLEESVAYAKKQLVEKGSVYPMFVTRNAEGKTNVIVTPWGDEAEKNVMVNYLTLYFLTENVQEYIFMAEMWFKKIHKTIPIPLESIANHPDKQEGLMIVQTYIEKGALVNHSKCFETHRNDGGGIVLKDMPQGEEMFGRFTSMINPLKPSAETLKAVKIVMKKLEKIVNFNIKPITH